MKVGNLVKRRDPAWDTQNQLGLVIELETFKQALNSKANNKVVKVQWLGGGLAYRPSTYGVGYCSW